MTDDKDPPIEKPGFIAGVKVVDIGDVRVSRGLSRRAFSSCPHKSMVYDNNERRIWCEDCERSVEAFDAFKVIVEQYNRAHADLTRRFNELEAAEKHNIRSLAAKAIDEAWRSRTMVPACPSCGMGIFPESFKNGCQSMVGKEYAKARLDASKGPKK